MLAALLRLTSTPFLASCGTRSGQRRAAVGRQVRGPGLWKGAGLRCITVWSREAALLASRYSLWCARATAHLGFGAFGLWGFARGGIRESLGLRSFCVVTLTAGRVYDLLVSGSLGFGTIGSPQWPSRGAECDMECCRFMHAAVR